MASLIAQTAPSPTVKAPPCGADACPSGVIGMLATSRAFAEPVPIRVSVLDVKLLAQTESPAAARARAGAPFAGGATRIGGATILPDPRSILVTVPRVGSAANRYRPALASDPGLPPTWMGLPAGRSVVGSSRPTSPPSRSANHTLPAATATAAGKPPTWTRLTDRVAVSIRSTSPESGSVVQTSPPAAASPTARPGDS